MKIYNGQRLEFHSSINDDGTNNGSIYHINSGKAYAIAKAPRFVSTEDWEHNASIIIKAIQYNHSQNPLLNRIKHIAHFGGLDGMDAYEALNEIRRLTLPL